MHKKFHEKARDFFIRMGKQHRILLPVAVVGLAVTMMITGICSFIAGGAKRFACAIFVLCFFFIGNSFAFPYFNFDNGFVEEAKEPGEVSASDSDLTLADAEGDEARSLDHVTSSEADEIVADTDFYSVDDILSELDEAELEAVWEAEDPEEPGKEPETEKTDAEELKLFDGTDWRLVLINKQHPIPENYEFTLGNLTNTMRCDERIIQDLVLMMQAAKEDGANLRIASPYRNDDRQTYLFNKKIDSYMRSGYSYMEAYKLASQAVTVPGASEHQVGLAIDFNTDTHVYLDEAFENTKEGKWLHDHCADFGFILRYPKHKEPVTGIEYEPWHFRYVGKEAAKIIMSEEICLEEFWDKYIE